jgi:HK97 family phage prohead protease
MENKMTDRYDEIRARRIEESQGHLERRVVSLPATLEVRATDSGTVAVGGWACRTGLDYDIGYPERGGWVEVVNAGAFRRTLSENPDVILNAGHGSSLSGLPLARTSTGTLRLREDDQGLRFDADLDTSDPDVQTLLPKMRRGDLNGASMCFRVTDDSWGDDGARRTIRSLSLAKGDVSIVPFGANPHASASVIPSGVAGRSARSTIFVPDRTTRARQKVSLLQRQLGIDPRTRPAPTRALSGTNYRDRVAELKAKVTR